MEKRELDPPDVNAPLARRVEAQCSDVESAIASKPASTIKPASIRVSAIRLFVLLGALMIAVDTAPKSWSVLQPFKDWLNSRLRYVGLSQGDWPLFAPNPVLNNGVIIAEVKDCDQQPGTWQSIDWERATVWDKFYRFRDMNYYQRVGRNQYALSDLADYLQAAIPTREHAKGKIRWSDTNEMLPPAELKPPIAHINLYQIQRKMILKDRGDMPKQSETMWRNHSNFLVRRDYLP